MSTRLAYFQMIPLSLMLSLSLLSGCRPVARANGATGPESSIESVATPATSAVQSPNELHTNISNQRRIQLISRVKVGDIMSAPGHAQLREPKKMIDLADTIRSNGGEGFENEPIIIGVFTNSKPGTGVMVRSIEVMDGNHRLAAGYYARKWNVIGDIPEAYIQVRVNGFTAGGTSSLPRWIPLDVAQKSSIPKDKWFQVPQSWGPKDATAQIPGDIASIDSAFPKEYQGVPMKKVVDISLARIGMPPMQ